MRIALHSMKTSNDYIIRRLTDDEMELIPRVIMSLNKVPDRQQRLSQTEIITLRLDRDSFHFILYPELVANTPDSKSYIVTLDLRKRLNDFLVKEKLGEFLDNR